MCPSQRRRKRSSSCCQNPAEKGYIHFASRKFASSRFVFRHDCDARVPGLLIQRLLLSLPMHDLSDPRDVEIELDDVMESRYGTNS